MWLTWTILYSNYFMEGKYKSRNNSYVSFLILWTAIHLACQFLFLLLDRQFEIAYKQILLIAQLKYYTLNHSFVMNEC